MSGVDLLFIVMTSLTVLGFVIAWVRSVEPTPPVVLQLMFSRGLERRSIEEFLGAALQGLRPPWWRRWMESPVVRFEMTADSAGLRHRLIVAEKHRARVESALRSHLPTVRFEVVDGTAVPRTTAAVEYRLSTAFRQLRVGDESVTRALLGMLTPMRQGERLIVQWIVSPSAPPLVPQRAQPTGTRAVLMNRAGSFPTDAEVTAAKEKLKYPVISGVLRIGASAKSVDRQRALLRHVESALHGTAAPGVHIRRRLLPKRWVARQLVHGSHPASDWPMIVNTHELAALVGFPFGAISNPALNLGGCRPMALSAAVSTSGTIIGDGFARGAARAAALGLDARVRHSLLVGSTGTGKTTLMTSMAVSDIEAGYGTLVIDPKGSDLVDGILERLPERHHDRVLVLNPGDAGRPVGLNPLRPTGVDPELAAEQVFGIANRIWADTMGIRSRDVIYAVMRTLIADPDASLVDVLPLLTEPAFRRPLVAQSTDVVLQAFWRQYGQLSDSEAAQWVAPVANKFRQLIGRPGLRRILGQAHPAIDVGEHLDRGGVVLVPLNSGLIGEEAASLFGALLLGQVWNVIQRRASQPVADRHPLMLHLDEFARYAKLSIPFEELLSQARSYRVGVTVACQHLHQIEGELRHAVLANPRTRIAFQVGAGDARVLAGEFGQGLTGDDLTGLNAYQVVAQLYATGRTQPAATLTTRPPSEPIADAADLRQASRARWGADGDAVEALIRQRFTSPTQSPATSGSSGRKRRSA